MQVIAWDSVNCRSLQRRQSGSKSGGRESGPRNCLSEPRKFKIFEKLFDFVKSHIKRQLYFVDRCHDSNFNFSTAPYCVVSQFATIATTVGLYSRISQCQFLTKSFIKLFHVYILGKGTAGRI